MIQRNRTLKGGTEVGTVRPSKWTKKDRESEKITLLAYFLTRPCIENLNVKEIIKEKRQ